MSNINPSALLAHIILQTRSNIDFLVSQNQISQADASQIISKLPAVDDSAVTALAQQTQSLTLAPSEPSVPETNPTPNPIVAARRGVPPPPRRAMRVRALWNWNDDEQDPNDLSFRAGDVFEVITETNADWWTGRHNSKQGLFPSNYVEKLETSSQANDNPPAQERDFSSPPYAPQYHHQSPMGPPSMGPPVGYQLPPPPNQQVVYNPYLAQPPGNVVAQSAPEQPPKKSRFGGMGNTLAQSAVGGVGFGAGSAVGSGIINSIF